VSQGGALYCRGAGAAAAAAAPVPEGKLNPTGSDSPNTTHPSDTSSSSSFDNSKMNNGHNNTTTKIKYINNKTVPSSSNNTINTNKKAKISNFENVTSIPTQTSYKKYLNFTFFFHVNFYNYNYFFLLSQ